MIDFRKMVIILYYQASFSPSRRARKRARELAPPPNLNIPCAHRSALAITCRMPLPNNLPGRHMAAGPIEYPESD